FENDPEYSDKAKLFSTMVQDISEFLVENRDKLTFGELKIKVAYDDPCHLVHAQKISAQPRLLLDNIPGLELVPLRESEMCCGSAGTFNVTQPDLSEKVLLRKMENIAASGAEAVATGNIGCMIQLKRARELTGVDLIARSLRNGTKPSKSSQ
ncbi:(Fe-S)-binding protein, partial [candidate division KSB1 bacterium]